VDLEERVERIARRTQEVLTPEELRTLLASNQRPRAYIGFEPSGLLTVAHFITTRKIRDLQEAGCDVTVFLADWHAWINDKLGGDLERIRASGRYMQAAFTALGVDPDRARFRWASELTDRADYWARVVRVAKSTSLARTKRAMSIMGRSEEEGTLDTSKLFYPAMQAADIFELPVEIAYGGMDQRRAHVLAREVAHQHGWPTPCAIHTPLLSSLKGGSRMDPSSGAIEGKMSKSDPGSAITLPAPSAEVADRIARAFCPAKQVEGNPVVELVEYVILPWLGTIEIPRAAKYGGPLSFQESTSFRAEWEAGKLHPADLKSGVVAGLDQLIEPTRRYFTDHPEVSPATFLGSP
jgi:tyrosyl-tRNA synthetase